MSKYTINPTKSLDQRYNYTVNGNKEGYGENQYNFLYLNMSPTANCQIGSFYNFVTLLHENKETQIEILKFTKNSGGLKAQMIIDINRTYEKKVEELIPEDMIVFKQQYRSTNESLMTMYLVKTTFL